MGITRARRGCSYPSRRGRRWSCSRTAQSGSCARGPRQPRSFPLYTSSPRRRSERRASKSGQTLQLHGGYDAGAVDGSGTGRARFGAACRLREFSIHRYSRADGDYLTGWAPAVAPASHHASRSGGWQTNTHLSRYLIAMLWGLDPAANPRDTSPYFSTMSTSLLSFAL